MVHLVIQRSCLRRSTGNLERKTQDQNNSTGAPAKAGALEVLHLALQPSCLRRSTEAT